ncbi:MAG: YcnI family copper-binding membrane protein [Nocardioides sp.]
MKHLLAAPALALAALIALAGGASAHVTVNPSTATGGSWSKLTFRVPTESETASTTKVQVYFPADAGFQSVTVKPHPGWSYSISRTNDTVEQITWTPITKAYEIRPGEFDEFDVSVGPLPDSGTLTFKALQTYSDGSVVRWIDIPASGQTEPEHPAPVLTITAADRATDEAGPSKPVPTAAQPAPDHTPLILASIALAVSVGAFAVAALRRKQG